MVPDLMEGRTETERTIIRGQIELAARGYYFGTADGVVGMIGRRALAEFQHAEGLPETREFDAAMLDRLGIT
jgi:peptidoglycan hydrolase-like protein with peptidoglycan-binding domain